MVLEIPVDLVPEPNDPLSIQVIADGRVGDDDIQFLIDTGARTCLVPLSSATRELASKRRSTATGAANIAAGDDEIVVPELRIGDLVARNVDADRAPLGENRHSLLGMNVLGSHRCWFRLADGAIDLDVPAPAGLNLHQIEADPTGIPFVTVDFDSVTVRACWDTGASRSVVDLAWAQQHPDLVTYGEQVPGHDSSGIEVRAFDALLAPCAIGGVVFSSSTCVAVDLSALNARLDHPFEVIIGVPIIQTAHWWFDFPEHQWGVTNT